MSNIIKLNARSDFNLFLQISEMHINSIHHGALPFLGKKLLARVYQFLSADDSAAVWICFENNKVFGFLTATIDLKNSFFKLMCNPLLLLYAIMSGFYFSPKAMKKILSIVLYPFSVASKTNSSIKNDYRSAELLSVAVSSEKRGAGIGRLLVEHLENWLLSKNIHSYRVTTNIEEVGSNRFYRSLDFKEIETIKHHALILQIYQKNI